MKKKKKKIKKHFTLLELIVTISLIVICFSVIGIKINKAVYEHKLKNCEKKINMYFDFCKKMAFCNQSDVYLKLYQKKNCMIIDMGCDDNIGFFKNTNRTKESFSEINFLFNKKKIDNIDILFSSTKGILPKGEIEFFDKKNKFKFVVVL